MIVKAIIINNGLATMTADMILDNEVVTYQIKEVYDRKSKDIKLVFDSLSLEYSNVPEDVKERLTNKLIEILAEF